jgi:hypothetical protein
MQHPAGQSLNHPVCSRRTAIQAGAIGLLGLGAGEVNALRAASGGKTAPPKAVIYIFLSGGLSQLESFDLKPNAPANIRGEFKPVATRTPGLQICEHLPGLAQRSNLWSLVRSMTHSTNGHSEGHHMMLTGRSDLPPGFNGSLPRPTDWPSIASVASSLSRPRNNLPPAAVLPERLVHTTGRVIPGQFAGQMGPAHDPWFIEASAFDPVAYGAYPEFEFSHENRPLKGRRKTFHVPDLSLPEGLGDGRLGNRIDLLRHLDAQRRQLDRAAEAGGFDRFRQAAVSLLTDQRVRRAFDVLDAPSAVLDRYGRNAFGWSLLMARRLVEAGVNLVQVNLGNNETWDTHGNAFPHLKDNLFPPTDKAVSALLDDLNSDGLLDSTLIVMASEFGRTPKISTLPQFYKLPGRDHWGAVQTVFFAGGGTQGGRVVGASDKNGGFPALDPQTPENMAATIYRALGLPGNAEWADAQGRPNSVFRGEPIAGLL